MPALDDEMYALGENFIGMALSTLRKVPETRKAELYAEALKRVVLFWPPNVVDRSLGLGHAPASEPLWELSR